MNPSSSASDSRAPLYIGLFFAFFCVLLIGFTVLSFYSYQGVVTEDAYEKGLAYNQTIDKAAASKRLGWRGDVAVVTDHGAQVAVANIYDNNGRAIKGATVKAFLVHYAQQELDRSVILMPAGDAYQGPMPLLQPGVWRVHVSVSRGGQQFQFEKSINLP